ncbi:serine/threonine protein kinase [Flexivirga sp. ID2601S]|uniref:non-specific serine/threonine protein kinase n=1 Tax=Flexivirga aerilata TaxID=1656889 RepID=A0A849ANL1_9MICO|nr:protein kinase [Flexivirga aerilata]NNG38392.1 serine/threonine protein kinase [Flexivirga aerilata]
MSSTGDLMGGRYRLTERIAAGGMGEVWQARDEILGRTVAVKLLKEGLTDEEGFTERFRNEARLSAALAHGNIAQVYDYGEDGNLAFLVMEYVPGKPLSKILSERGPISAADTVGLIGQAAAALHAAHRAGLIHRDVKPANMLVTPDGVVKLTDFGIARAVGSTAMTKTGEVMGTAQYLAPEAAMGRDTTALTDVYSLAVVTYEMLGGRRPFNADSAVALALQHVNDAPPPLPAEVPPPVRAVVHVGLEKDPALRPDSAQEYGRALRQAVSDSQQLGYNPYAAPPRPVPASAQGGVGGGSGPQSGPQSGPPAGSQAGSQSGPHSGTHPGPPSGPQSGSQSGVQSGPQATGASGGRRLPSSSGRSSSSPGGEASPHATGSQVTGTRSRRLSPLAIGLGILALVVVIGIVIGVAVVNSGGGNKVPSPPNTGPFNSPLVTYTPQASS